MALLMAGSRLGGWLASLPTGNSQMLSGDRTGQVCWWSGGRVGGGWWEMTSTKLLSTLSPMENKGTKVHMSIS